MNRDQHVHQRLVDLAKSLLKRTEDGNISWTTTDNESVFLFSGTNTSVRVSSYIDDDNDMRTKMSLLNSRGTVVESLESEFRRGPFDEVQPAPWNQTLNDLYHSAKRSALNVDAVLDDLLADLDDENRTNRAANEEKADPWSDEPPF
jgi:hypothetical protein